MFDLKADSIKYGPRPKELARHEEAMDIEELEYYEPELADTDHVTEEYDLEFLESESAQIREGLVTLQRMFEVDYSRLVRLSAKVQKVKAAHMLLDDLVYNGKVILIKFIHLYYYQFKQKGKIMEKHKKGNFYYINPRNYSKKEMKKLEKKNIFSKVKYDQVNLKSPQEALKCLQSMETKFLMTQMFTLYTEKLKELSNKYKSSALDSMLSQNVKIKKFDSLVNYKLLKKIKNKFLRDCVYIHGNTFLFYSYKVGKYVFKMKSFNFHTKSTKEKCNITIILVI